MKHIFPFLYKKIVWPIVVWRLSKHASRITKHSGETMLEWIVDGKRTASVCAGIHPFSIFDTHGYDLIPWEKSKPREFYATGVDGVLRKYRDTGSGTCEEIQQ